MNRQGRWSRVRRALLLLAVLWLLPGNGSAVSGEAGPPPGETGSVYDSPEATGASAGREMPLQQEGEVWFDPSVTRWSGDERGAEPFRRLPQGQAATRRGGLQHRVYQYQPDASRSFGTESMLSEYSKEVAGKVFYELKGDGERHASAKVAVVSAVPLSDLKRETEFGRVIAEYYLTDLADRGIRVTELRLGRDINILPQTGEFILSRNIGELANNAPALDYVVVSTFTNTRKTLILQGRLVSLKTGTVKTSWRYSMPLNRELLSFFQSGESPYTIAVKGVGQ